MIIYLTALFSDFGYVASNGKVVMNSWLKVRRKEAALACLFQHMP
jgi:hypothetical protein